MTMARVEVITSVQRRRRWSREAKERIVAAALEPGAVASEVARQAGIYTSQLFRWRRQLCGPARPAAGFAAVTVAAERASAAALPPLPGVIEIAFSTGVRLQISGAVDPATLTVAVSAAAAAARQR